MTSVVYDYIYIYNVEYKSMIWTYLDFPRYTDGGYIGTICRLCKHVINFITTVEHCDR